MQCAIYCISRTTEAAVPKEEKLVKSQVVKRLLSGWSAAVLAAGVVLGVAACGSDDGSSSSSTSVGSKPAATAALGATQGVLKFGMNPGYPPWDQYVGNSFAGADYDIGQEIAKRLDLKPVWTQIDFGALITSLKTKRIDVILSGMSDTKERQKVVDFVDYYNTPWGFMVPKGNPKGLKSLADLCGVRASAETGTAGVGFLQTQNKKCKASGKSIQISTFDKVPAIQQAIRSGRTDVDLENYDALSYAAGKLGEGEVFEAVALSDLPTSPYGIGIAKGNDPLLQAVKKAFEAIIDDGTYDKILQKNGITAGGVKSAVINGATS
jgi:polar amino acid transport system substrate-binding protein